MTPAFPRPFGYEALMPNLVRDVLLVASPYDRFILEEDGRFADRLLSQYADMELAAPPRFSHVSTAKQALERLKASHFDLVLITPHCADMRPLQLAYKVSRKFPRTRVAMLTYDHSDAQLYSQHPRGEGLQQVFLWNGNPRLLVTLVKSVEDLLNVDHDTRAGLVRVIIVVEDSPAFYSSYLSLIYREILSQIQILLKERLNEKDRRYRRRARPKILLARNYEEAVELFERYHEYLLGTICDMRFPRRRVLDSNAGRDFIRMVRQRQPDVPVLLQSSDASHAPLAKEMGIHFADKNSPELLAQVRQFIRHNFGFGPFIFRDPDGEEVARADQMEQMLEALRIVPSETLHLHGARNHISNWLMARSEFALALELRPKKVSDFRTTEELRSYVVQIFAGFLEARQRGQITEYARGQKALVRDFTRIGSGSMGGKGRGIAFVSQVLAESSIHEKYPQVRIFVPRTAVLGTDVFEHYCDRDGLGEKALAAETDDEVVRLFLEHPLDPELMKDLAEVLSHVRYPLAVRSSSLHEDSESQPLAGLYKTFMLPNCASSDELRLDQLSKSIRLIFASTFLSATRNYMKASSIRLEEERMGVILQRLVGHRHGDTFYPDFAGVAQSFNYYPFRSMRSREGIATVALGLGQTVVAGGRALRFCPAHPHLLPQMPNPRLALRNTQRDFYALDLSHPDFEPGIDEATNLVLLDLDVAKGHGTLEAVGATYSRENDTIYDTVHRPGVPLVNFSGVLRHGRFPLAELVQDLLAIGKEGMGTEVEMEFAVSLGQGDRPPELAVLQLRPLVTQGREVEVDLEGSGAFRVPLISAPALGNGVISGIRDIVYVHPKTFELSATEAIAREVSKINRRLQRAGRPYLLMGPGRWGTQDPCLGIPVQWREVAGAKVIVELELPELSIDPSQGSHFFHNLTSLRIGYFNLDMGNREHLLNLGFLDHQPAENESKHVRHVALSKALEVFIDGRVREGLVFHS